MLLDDRLDDEGRVRAAPSRSQVTTSTALGAELLDSARLRGATASERAHRTTGPWRGRDGRQAARDRAAPDDPEPL